MNEKQEARFWPKVQVVSSGCWEWSGGTSCGYGMFALISSGPRHLSRRAHKVLYEHIHGVIPVGLVVCHTCDNRLCVRIDHLWVGTQADNLKDMTDKGRRGRGGGRPRTKTEMV